MDVALTRGLLAVASTGLFAVFIGWLWGDVFSYDSESLDPKLILSRIGDTDYCGVKLSHRA